LSNSILAKAGDFLPIVLIIQLSLDITVFLNIPVARQVLGFVYLTFIPGFLIIKILKINKLSFFETVLLSVGLSIGFLMLFGLLINFFLPLIDITRPFSVVPITVMFNIVVVLGVVGAYFRNKEIKLCLPKLSFRYLLFLILLCIPLLSIVGAMFVNVYQNNLLLLIMLLLIAFTFAVFSLLKKLSFSKVYPIIIIIFAVSLLFHFSLISNYVHGPDSGSEYAAIFNTQSNALWDSIGPYPHNLDFGRLNSMLSVTILPTTYSSLLGIDATWTYKIIFPLIFALLPLVLYKTWQPYVGKKYAFISCFLFLAEPTFYGEMLSLARQMVGELFFALLLFVILKKEMKQFERTFLFVLFSFGLIVSHYALAEILLFFIILVFIVTQIYQRLSKSSTGYISFSMILLFFVMMFSWYIFTSNSSILESFLNFGQNVLNQLSDFANPASRGQTVLMGLGVTSSPTIWNSISRIFAYLSEAFIVIGFIGLISKRVKTNYDRDSILFTSLALVLLAGLIIVPGLAATLNMSRFYHILLIFLAPLCILGAQVIAVLIYKRKIELISSILLVVVLVGYFLFQSGFIYELSGTQNYSLPLGGDSFGQSLSYQFATVTEQEVVGAQWLSQHYRAGQTQIYAGYLTPLIGYGFLNITMLSELSNVTRPNGGDFVYLGDMNTRFNLVVTNYYVWNTSDIQNTILTSSSHVYSSGNCEIYKFTSSP
jgi:uncharacterized membrane protein